MRSIEHKSIKVCLITGIFPPDIGGPATYVSRLAHSLQQDGRETRVFTLGDDDREYPFPVTRISRRHPLPIKLALLFVLLLREGWRYDVWYINGLELPAVLAGKLLRKRLVMKVVGDHAWERAMNKGLTSDRIDDFQKKSQHWRVEGHKTLRAWLTRQVDRVITPSAYLKSLVLGWGIPEQHIHVIYNAVEASPMQLRPAAEIRKQFGIAHEDRLLVTVGRLVKWKGIDELIRSLAHLDDTVKLLIVGDGPERNKLTDLVENLRLGTRVILAGKLDRNLTFACIQASELFILNTAYEGFSHVLLEAMMLGTPVITTSVCGNPELVQHQENGILIPWGDRHELTAQINQLLHDSAFTARLSAQGKHGVHKYSWEQLLRNTLAVLGTSDR